MRTITLLFLSFAATTEAAVIVSAFGQGPGGNFEISGNSSDFSGATHLHATAVSSGSTFVGPGSLGSSCTACFPHGVGRAEANAATGLLRASGGTSVSSGGFGGGGSAMITDVITFMSPTPQITIRFDGSLLATDPGHASVSFAILALGNGEGDTGGDQDLVRVSAYDGGGEYYTVDGSLTTTPGYLTGLSPGAFFESVPEVFEFTLTLPSIYSGIPMSLGFSLEAGAHDESSGHTARADYEHTAYIGIKGPYISDSGYSYTGFTPDATVPEPATSAVVGCVLLGLGLVAKRRYRG